MILNNSLSAGLLLYEEIHGKYSQREHPPTIHFLCAAYPPILNPNIDVPVCLSSSLSWMK